MTDAEYEAGVMCKGIQEVCEMKDECAFVVSLDDCEILASELPYFKDG